MTPELFLKAKDQFFRLVDLDESARERELKLLEQMDQNLANEVRSLLENHSSQTIIKANPVTLNASNDSTFSRTHTLTLQKLRASLLGGIYPISIAIIASAALAMLGWGMQSIIQNRIAVAKTSHLVTLVDLEQNLLNQWRQAVSLKVESWVRSATVRKAVMEMVAISRQHVDDPDQMREALQKSPAQLALEKEINALSGISWIGSEPPENAQRFAVWNREGVTIADWNRRKLPLVIGRGPSPQGASKLSRVFQESQGKKTSTMVFLPNSVSTDAITMDYPTDTNRSQIQVLTAVFDDNGLPIAALLIRDQRMTDDFEAAIRDGQFEKTGECFLMDSDGWMINEPRCVEQMKKFDVFGEYCRKSDKRYLVRVADPGGDVFNGFKPEAPLKQWARTKAGRVALDKQSGFDIDGYRDFAGRNVIGAWQWNEELQAAIFVEQDKDEAFQSIKIIESVNRVAWGIPLLIAIAIAVGSGVREGMTRGSPPKKIGAYRVLGKIGEGGLGIVYRAEHRLLGRASAIKVLKSKSINNQLIKRFEREVCLAARLVHPNAVSIFDYGISDKGAFYYAMEYINGVNLAEFVSYAKSVSLDRTIHMLLQICGAIREAHLEGLVHRDIKPQNIMVCYRGGMADVVKVLDYGLVKSFVSSRSSDTMETRVLMGTPRFMAPERLETPWLADPRIDIFSIGTVAYYLLLGQTPVLGTTPQGMLERMASPESPYQDLANQKPFQELIRLIGFCVSPEPSLRPGSVGAIIEVLQKISLSFPWQQSLAETWWAEHEADLLDFGSKLRQLQSSEIMPAKSVEDKA